MKKLTLSLLALITLFASCNNDDNPKNQEPEVVVNENPATFKEISSISIGGEGAAEITAYDEKTKKLFTVNNSSTNQIDVIDLSDPTKPTKISKIDLTPYEGASNSVAIFDGKLAVALESTVNKQANGKVVVFNTTDYSVIKQITVGALPDMVTFSPDGKYIMTANEGEPNTTYTQDPNGTISIIEVANNYAVTTLDFASFSTQLSTLKKDGFRISSFAISFAADVEPEYVTISDDSKTAWVTMQENNGVAKVDLASKTITAIFPLGFKDFNTAENGIDVSDKDDKVAFSPWKVKGMYMPDAISHFTINNTPYFVTVNEGDAREYNAYSDIKRMKDVKLDASVFPDAATLKLETNLGRLNLIADMGDTDGDGDLDEMVSFGARSFSIWNGNTGKIVYDSKNDLDKKSQEFGTYDDKRSDDKGSEPEAVVVAKMGTQSILFVGVERSDAFLTYDVTNPAAPQYLQTVKTGDAPEGLLFIPASKSPTKRSLVIVSSEGDGVIKIYQPDLK
ncbi:choice-of-anchor I family protein [Flavobacterium sp. Fl-77]|uniref:Choice-of-anchor I family protein n=1 Tax=Flavobacterium flavipigmentatum TaxID=2893884 RepID=A0AAJ2SG78_9FLAO|nr:MULTISPECIES: choice-of-anchor I family protein [unclassified Flavobacterium]MDX6181468.1 choice-of-anchor I family protein [Flavobacterium sp. Fl-33]MDX6185498.1 choice-of-anchor I family protein [Flavobacterium sp. Fl-77]UFH37601.1 choice-of-anchor I family protein [Flavobacterium sp. F-70]